MHQGGRQSGDKESAEIPQKCHAAVDLGALVQEALASFEEAARVGELRMEAAAPSGVRIDADPTKCMQVLMNLVSNAVKYTPKGGHVAVRVTAGEKEAEVAITDNGLGMTSDQLGQLFQPFVRVHEGIAGVAKGTGLGLYISKGIVEQHGGRMWFESEEPVR
jgi:chemotaxis family two-component system sensor kinase Cph1